MGWGDPGWTLSPTSLDHTDPKIAHLSSVCPPDPPIKLGPCLLKARGSPGHSVKDASLTLRILTPGARPLLPRWSLTKPDSSFKTTKKPAHAQPAAAPLLKLGSEPRGYQVAPSGSNSLQSQFGANSLQASPRLSRGRVGGCQWSWPSWPVGVGQEMSHGWGGRGGPGGWRWEASSAIPIKGLSEGFLYVDLVFPGERVGGLHWGLVPSIEL